MRAQELLIYREMEHEDILMDMSFLIEREAGDSFQKANQKRVLSTCVKRLIELATHMGFEGNLWHVYLTFLLVNSENAYSISCEKRETIEGTINQFANHDFAIFRELFQVDLKSLGCNLGIDCIEELMRYEGVQGEERLFNRRIRNRICELAVHLANACDEQEFRELVTRFYGEFGVGKFGLHKAFRLADDETQLEIVPITNIAHVHLDDLVGYEIPKNKLIENTEAFVAGRRANNCLLFGDAGTGKSTCIKAILNQYYDQGLRIIEIYKHQFHNLNAIITQIKNRNYKFIIYMDDLSFEEFEIEYKYLKAVIEGGLERKPNNVLIYATSNRRHLVREEVGDKVGRREDLHASDTVQEKLSLVARFGVSIFFVGPSQSEFQEIVLTLARRNKIEMNEQELLLAANKWELSHGGRSGRTAQQFIDYLLGKK